MALLARANPPDLARDNEWLVQARQRELARDPLADPQRCTRGNEDSAETDVAGFSGDALAGDAEHDRESDVDSTRARDQGHAPHIVT
jgi:hypothetical protein